MWPRSGSVLWENLDAVLLNDKKKYKTVSSEDYTHFFFFSERKYKELLTYCLKFWRSKERGSYFHFVSILFECSTTYCSFKNKSRSYLGGKSVETYFVAYVENVSCVLENTIYCAVVGWNILYTSVRSNWFILLFKSSISFLLFCLVVLAIIESGVLKYQNTTVPLFLPSILFIFLLHTLWGSVIRYVKVYNCYMLMLYISFIINILLFLLKHVLIEVCFV